MLVANPTTEDDTKGRRVKPGKQIKHRETKMRKQLGRKNRRKFARRLLTTTEDPISSFDNDAQRVSEEHIDIGLMDLPVVKLMSQKLLSGGEKILEELEDNSNLDDNNVDNDISSKTIEVRLRAITALCTS